MNKNTKSPVTKKSEAGMNLISLMVGIALSTVTMLTATHMHTSHQLAVNDLNNSIGHNRTVLTSLSVIEKEVRSAGYGISGADRNHILIEYDAGDATTPATRSLSWRFMTDDNDDGIHDIPHCRKLVESGGTINDTQHRILTLIKSSSCHTNNPIEDTIWDEPMGRLGQWAIKNELLTHISSNNTLFNFVLDTAECSFPSLDNPKTHLLLTIEAPNSAELNGHTQTIKNGIKVCLTNMTP